MTIQQNQIKRHYLRRASGFTLMEVIIAITLTALLMTAMGTALNAGLKSYEDNSNMAEQSQAVRAILARMHREICNASDVDWIYGSSASILKITTPGKGDVYYIHDRFNNILIYTRNYTGSYEHYTLLGSGDAIRVTDMTGSLTSSSESPDIIELVSIKLAMTCNGKSFTVSTSGSLRRNLPH